jgi:hypothetical protein
LKTSRAIASPGHSPSKEGGGPVIPAS